MSGSQVSAAQMLMNFISGAQRKLSRSLSTGAFSREILTQRKAILGAQGDGASSQSPGSIGNDAEPSGSNPAVSNLRGKDKFLDNIGTGRAPGRTGSDRPYEEFGGTVDATAPADEVKLDLTALDQILAQFGVAAETRGRLLDLAGSGRDVSLSQVSGLLKENAGIDLRVAAPGQVSGTEVRGLLNSRNDAGAHAPVTTTGRWAGIQFKTQYDLKDFKALIGRLSQPVRTGSETLGAGQNRGRSQSLVGKDEAKIQGISPREEYSEQILDRALPTFVQDQPDSLRARDEAGRTEVKIGDARFNVMTKTNTTEEIRDSETGIASQVSSRAAADRMIRDGDPGSSGDFSGHLEVTATSRSFLRDRGFVPVGRENKAMTAYSTAQVPSVSVDARGSRTDGQENPMLQGRSLDTPVLSQLEAESPIVGSQGIPLVQARSLGPAVASQPGPIVGGIIDARDYSQARPWNEISTVRFDQHTAGLPAGSLPPKPDSRQGSMDFQAVPGLGSARRGSEADRVTRAQESPTPAGLGQGAPEPVEPAEPSSRSTILEAPERRSQHSSRQPLANSGEDLGTSVGTMTSGGMGTAVGGDALDRDAADANPFGMWEQLGIQLGTASDSGTPSGATGESPRLAFTDDAWPSQLARQFKSLQQQPVNQLVLRLEPENLGTLVLRLRTKHNMVTASITADNENTRQILLQNAPALRQQMEQQGFSLSGFSVDLGGQSNPNASGHARSELAAIAARYGRGGSEAGGPAGLSESVIIQQQYAPDQLVNLIV